MVAFTKKAEEPICPACINIALHPAPFYRTYTICYNDLPGNTCFVYKQRYITCNQYCSSFPGMECIIASHAYCGPLTSSTPQVSCDSDAPYCMCGFVPGAIEQNKLVHDLFQSDHEYCPLYPDGLVNNATRRKLDDYTDSYTYNRYYKLLTLKVDYDYEKADGSAKIVDSFSEWPWGNDYYKTGTPEMCTGLESLIRPGDPAWKCSFGFRPYKSAAYNCFGKLYGMNFAEASEKCSARGGHLAKIDTVEKFNAITSLFKFDTLLVIGLYDIGRNNYRWDGYSNIPVNNSWFSTLPFVDLTQNAGTVDCMMIYFPPDQPPFLTAINCQTKSTYLCEGKANPSTPWVGGDLLADEGGFCIWYYSDPTISLPDDQSGNFQNTELAHFLLYDTYKSTKKYRVLYDTIYPINNIPGHPENIANWQSLTRRKVGQNSDKPVFPPESHNYSFHCHFSPTNFGMSRIYSQQHMLERLYPGSVRQNCFCGYKYLGNLVDRCDCTRSGEQSNQCSTAHTKLLYDETYAETGEYVACNNCDNPGP